MNTERNKEIFTSIEKKLKMELIGQEEFAHKLCDYFEGKLSKGEKGILLLAGSRDTFKKASIRSLFSKLNEEKLVERGEVDEIDLSTYNFNLGYNSFLTDLYEKLNSNSEVVIFKNTEKASEEILNLLSSIHPNTCVLLNNDYVVKNKFLIEADDTDQDKINKLICHNKFFIFVYNSESRENIEDLFPNKDKTIYTKSLTKEERRVVFKTEVLKDINRVEESLKVNVLVEEDDENESNNEIGLSTYLQDNFKEEKGFGVSEYVSYKLYKPMVNLIRTEAIGEGSHIQLYINDNEIYCKANNEIFKLNDYSVPTLEEARYKLDSIIGMKDLKDFIVNVQNNYKVQKIRERLGLKTSQISMNMIFAGNAGTGKTNAARVTFEYLNALGILSRGVFVEVSKADFVTENSSDTAKRTIDIINSAIGGVLFIDEAYSLCESEDDKIGKEIVDALLKGIEDNRDDLIVILAGYEKDMEKFLSFNQGLKSRFPNTIHFLDYNPIEMYEIAVNIAKSKGYRIDSNVKSGLIDLFTRNQLTGKNDLGNARFVRNIVENAIMDASKKYLTNSKREIDLLQRDNFNFKVNAKFDLEEKLSEIIGLEDVKKLIRSQYKLIVAQEKRKSVGVTTKIEQNLNMVFAGNPGTGKTSIARLVAEMLNSMGLLKIGQLVETDRSSFVSEVPGETSKKTEEKFKEAIGGILFIDEAYTLANDSLGREAIETLLKLIEDYSSDVIVILAGYEKEMEDFFDVNIGLRSRFPLWTNFEDYNPNELLEMSIRLVEQKGFKLSKNAYVALKKSFVDIYENSDAQSGNGRMVRNYVENLIRNQSIRISEEDISVYEMNLITAKDIEKINVAEYDNEFDLESKLKAVVGNEKSKEFLRNQYKLMKVKEKRKRLGSFGDLNRYMNIVFTGEIGTGKKTVLNIYSEMLYSMGIVKAKNILELDKLEIMSMMNKGLKLEDIFNKFLGKVLLIDKSDLFLEEENCNEIITELIKFIDNNRNKTIIVLSGEKEGMKKLVLSNQGLNYRFPTWVDFENYNEAEKVNIALNILKSKGYSLTPDGKEELINSIGEMHREKDLTLKNGLMIKQYLDNLVRVHSIRICGDKLLQEEINIINERDVIIAKEEFLKKNKATWKISKDKVSYNKNPIVDIPVASTSIVDELLKLKSLLDSGIVTEEEFEKIKKRIIG
ncbi:AAA family ATPase [Clostridium paraputrificum]|uniref:AAA family ATPase n=1 Tax=Clostridium paraputrificum TaxID=29363 RepID=UPI003D32AD13